MMGPLLGEFLAAILRWALTMVFAVLVDRHVLSPHDGDYFSMEFAKHATYVGGALVVLGWGLWAKYRSRVKFLTALEAGPGMTEQGIEHRIANGAGATIRSSAIALALVALLPTFASAQTIILTPAQVWMWNDPEHNAVSQLDGVTPIVSNYLIELFPPAQVTAGVPTGNPVASINLGKPVSATGVGITSTPIIPFLPALDTPYYGFLRAVGSGGTSPRSNAIGPFGAPRAPGAPTGAKTSP
jgi:hypothetical protein